VRVLGGCLVLFALLLLGAERATADRGTKLRWPLLLTSAFAAVVGIVLLSDVAAGS
jgi:hypothetical protein